MQYAPSVLILFRLLCAPAIIVLALRHADGRALAVMVGAAFLSDVFDGIIARREGVATPHLRRADTLTDTAFYAASLTALWLNVPSAFDGLANLLLIFGAIHTARVVFEVRKFGRKASYHMWSSKLFGLLLAGGLMRGFATGSTSGLLTLALVAGTWNEIEGLAASMVLPTWLTDVPSIVHAARAARLRA